MRRLILLVSLVGLAGDAVGQERVLSKASARLNHQFSSILGLRELSDGRVLVSDGIDNVLLRANLATQKLDTIGRTGQGPGEYKAPDALWPLPGDGTLLVDLGNGRMSLFDGLGKYQESLPIAQGTPGGPGGFSLIIPRGTDGQGRLYYQPMGGGPRADSAPVVRWDRAAGKFDTLALVKLPAMITKSSGGPNNQRQMQRPPTYPVQDAWTVGADGRLALVRAPGYRVDWVAGGKRVVGKPIPASPVPVRDAEKREYLAELASNGLSVSVENNNGSVSMRFGRGRQGRSGDDEQPDLGGQEWPATKPAFTGVLAVDPAGRLWVERSVSAGAPRRYDVVGPDGAVMMQVALPNGRRLVAVGAKGAYARHVDPDGINYLERYDLP
ncbi:MAG: hypothetical protein ACKVZ0_24530 [Gemmatimonadales bacterium]